ncbi:MAG TPA: substrate-binding domain-containing protein [Bryobacteraceae bacterium]|nr:substrate-binding domain-containing protein [Bryobacteraceae bacterium]HOQ46065.1 substrate-binding domain-containing protein [Bryobacteraceae bacterium]HPU72824.1 substrate-binding domain-containing protein [Bryobacteraceae bacterium]
MLRFIVAGALATSLLSCGGSRHDPSEIYYLVTLNSKIPYWRAALAGFQDAATQYQVKWEMVGPETYDVQAQKAEFQKALSKNPSGIMVSVGDPAVMAPEIDAAIERGVPVITIDSDAPKSKRLLFIGTNNYEAGLMGARIVAEQLKGKGNVIVFTMPEQPNLKERLNGYEQVFRGHPGIKITEVVDIKGDPTVAFDKTMELVEKNAPVDAFVCLEALACPEVAEVLTRRQVKGKTVVAMDTDPRTLEMIQKGVIHATIAQKPYTMAFFGLQVLDQLNHYKPPSLTLNWAQDTRSPLPSFVDTGATLIDKNNVDAFLKAEAGSAQ